MPDQTSGVALRVDPEEPLIDGKAFFRDLREAAGLYLFAACYNCANVTGPLADMPETCGECGGMRFVDICRSTPVPPVRSLEDMHRDRDLMIRVERWRRTPLPHTRNRVEVLDDAGAVLAGVEYDAVDNEAHIDGALKALAGYDERAALARTFYHDGDAWVFCCEIGQTNAG